MPKKPSGDPGQDERSGPLLLLDGYSLAYRAFYALPADLATPTGTVTNAVYGFTSMLVYLLNEQKPGGIAVVFDAPGGSFRHELDDEYKANRKERPELFGPQVPLIREVVEALEIPIVEIPGFEADDTIATLATTAAASGIDVIIVTGDRDSYQLVADPHIRVLYNRRGVSDYALYDEAGIFERTGVTPAQYIDYASMRGDTSDNLPGVPGIGEKTAAKLITTYGNLEGIYDHLDDLPPKQRQNLAEAKDRVFLNRRMITLTRNVEVDRGPADLRMGEFDRESVRALFGQLAFRTLYPRLLEAVGAPAGTDVSDARSMADRIDVAICRDVASLVSAVTAAPRLALAPRWSDTKGSRRAVIGLGVATDDRAWFVPGELVESLCDALFDEAAARPRSNVKPASKAIDVASARSSTASPSPKLMVHGGKELFRALGQPHLAAVIDVDTEIVAYLIEPGSANGYPFDDLVRRHLGIDLAAAADAATSQGTFDFDGQAAATLTGRRARALLDLVDALDVSLDALELRHVYETVERPLVGVLTRMEAAGVRIDSDFLHALASDLTKECEVLQQRIHLHAGEAFNINSTQQLQRILYDQLGLKPLKKTKTGASTDAATLQKLVDEHPIIEDLLRFRELDKLRSTYAEAFPPLVESDGRIHAVFNQTVASTGRISSEQPNLQNIPVRSADGREFRRAFIPADGCQLLAADYSQIEMRVLAHLADDPGLIEAFRRRADVHTATAARVYGVDESDVTAEQRRFAKVVNYGLAYGMEAYGLATRLDIPTDEAREILDNYFAGFPNVAAYMEQIVKEARATGYTTTILGRRRPIPELASDNFRIRQMGQRMAQNAPVQGSAADIFKLAMVNLDEALRRDGHESRMVLTVHDELVLEVPGDEVDEVPPLVRRIMETAVELKVPLDVDLALGSTWAEAKEH